VPNPLVVEALRLVAETLGETQDGVAYGSLVFGVVFWKGGGA
jgi:hypothetical protein